MPSPLPGQRWISETEPELGLGLVLSAEKRRVTLHFPATAEQRIYDIKLAPLARVEFVAGDEIETEDGERHTVDTVEKEDTFLVYHANGSVIPEALLASRTVSAVAGPEGRLLRREVDDPSDFDLRLETLHRRADYRQLPVRGLIGARVDLIGHQLFIANEVVSRRVPRVLLADETGLGKTIEAAMIIHRLILSGRTARVLILVPESLVHQWFVELLRRFNLAFTIVNQDYCDAYEDTNPFAMTQLALASIELLTSSPKRLEQAAEAGWDLLTVDEAHHLAWTPGQASPEYQTVEKLAKNTEGLLLLTATPRQLGEEGHFARLRLLDPARHADFKAYEHDNEQLPAVARAAEKLASGEILTEAQLDDFLQQLPAELRDDIEMRLEIAATDETERERLVQELIDRHGIGRVMFRNVRAALQGHFPERELHPAPLETTDPDTIAKIQAESAADIAGTTVDSYDYAADPRIEWIESLLEYLDGEKALLISSSRAKAEAIAGALLDQGIDAEVFHEGLDLIERDRNAAMFAEPDGQQLLICSEIGSEGRNFQFAQHLILWDVPLNPAMLEQRIGRLDRIGQEGDVNIHVPYVLGTAQELLFRWHQDGLHGIEHSQHGGDAYLARFGSRVRDLSKRMPTAQPVEVESLIAETRKFQRQVSKRLEEGRDRLHELASCRPSVAARLVEAIGAVDDQPELEDYAVRLFEWLGWSVERLENRAYVLEHDVENAASLPCLRSAGDSATFDRTRSLEREDWQFLTWDHPAVREGMEWVARNERGSAALGTWDDLGVDWIVECVFTLEPIAPPALHADRFLPPTPLRIVFAHDGQDESENYPESVLRGVVRPPRPGQQLPGGLGEILARAEDAIQTPRRARIDTALKNLDALYNRELDRLAELAERNRLVSEEESEMLKKEREQLRYAIGNALPRLDSLRVVVAE